MCITHLMLTSRSLLTMPLMYLDDRNLLNHSDDGFQLAEREREHSFFNSNLTSFFISLKPDSTCSRFHLSITHRSDLHAVL